MFWKYPYTNPTELGRNLVPNPSCELDTATYSAGTGSATLSSSALVGGWVGSRALRALVGTSGTNDVQIDYQHITVQPGVTYTFSFYSRGTATRTVRGLLRFYTAAGVQVDSTVIGESADPGSSWTRLQVTATAPAGGVRCSPVLRVSSAGAGDSHYFDGIMLTATPAAVPYFDGATPVAGRVFSRWLGPAHGSVSVQELPGAADELQPAMDVVTPFAYDVEARTAAFELLESSAVRTSWFAPSARAGTLRVGMATLADANAAVRWFSTNSVFVLDADGAPEADLTFSVAGGRLSLSRDPDSEAVVVQVPFKELTT